MKKIKDRQKLVANSEDVTLSNLKQKGRIKKK